MLSHFSRVQLCVTPWTAAHQAPPSLGFSRQEHWSGLPFPSQKVKSLSRVWLFTTPWTAAHQAPPSMGFSRQEYWSGVPLPSYLLTPNFQIDFWFLMQVFFRYNPMLLEYPPVFRRLPYILSLAFLQNNVQKRQHGCVHTCMCLIHVCIWN